MLSAGLTLGCVSVCELFVVISPRIAHITTNFADYPPFDTGRRSGTLGGSTKNEHIIMITAADYSLPLHCSPPVRSSLARSDFFVGISLSSLASSPIEHSRLDSVLGRYSTAATILVRRFLHTNIRLHNRIFPLHQLIPDLRDSSML